MQSFDPELGAVLSLVEGDACCPVFPVPVAAKRPGVVSGCGGEDCGDDDVVGLVVGGAEPNRGLEVRDQSRSGERRSAGPHP